MLFLLFYRSLLNKNPESLMKADYYKKSASSYDSTWKRYTNNTHKKLLEYLPTSLANKRVLDFGCGTGALMKTLLIRHPELAHLSGYDPSAEMLQQAQKKMGEFSEQVQRKVQLQTQLDFETKFDLIVSSSVLHYLPQPGASLRTLKSLLREGGSLVLVDYTKDGLLVKYFEWTFKFIDSLHQQAYSPREIRQLVEKAGFTAVKDEAFPISPLWQGYVIRALARAGSEKEAS